MPGEATAKKRTFLMNLPMQDHRRYRHVKSCLPIALTLLSWHPARADFTRIAYERTDLVVDLEVGLWAVPLVMDYDGDGDLDLLVSTANKTSNGIYFFENPGGDPKSVVFRSGVRVGDARHNAVVSQVGDTPHVLTPGKWHRDFLRHGLDDTRATRLPFEPSFHRGRANQWQFVDYDGDGVQDLIVSTSDWREYGWDNAFNSDGQWTRGPLHGHVYWMRNTQTDADPRYENARQIQAGGAPLDVFGCPSANFSDWDGDGDLDLICGEFLDQFTFFQNVGSRRQPAYRGGVRLEHDGKPLRMDLQMLQVTAVDWDRDGDDDLIVGQEDGRVALVECTGKVVDSRPDFLPPRFFKQQAKDLKVGALVTPWSCDWDGDGDEDLICGDTAGYVHFVENLGGNPPRWQPPQKLLASGEVIRIQAGPNGSIQGPAEAKWGYTVPTVGDWDHDGVLDLMINSIWGEILWFRGREGSGGPTLEAARSVEVEWNGAPPKPAWNWWTPRGEQLVTQWRTSPIIIDLDADGLNDLVVLDHEGYLAFFKRRRVASGLELLPGARIFLTEKREPLRLNARAAGKSGRRKLTLVDWNRDGKLDLLVNSKSVDFYRNVATEPGQFIFRPEGAVDAQILAGHTTCPTTVDWDGDGTRDLLVGAEDGFLYFLANPND